jgi:hypothetical protein
MVVRPIAKLSEETCSGPARDVSVRRAPGIALGKLDPRPDVHVDDDADDLEDLLQAGRSCAGTAEGRARR